MKILIIGGGNMGVTYARAFINSHVVNQDQLTILEKDKNNRLQVLRNLNLAKITSDPSCVTEADLIILSVKPQDTPTLFAQIEPYIETNQVVLSIMAGIKISTIQDNLKVKKIIRAMPNLPSLIGSGMTAFTSTDDVSRFEIGAIQNLLASTGKTLNVSQEQMIDAVTAISGSGPAYIYYFMGAMISAAVEMGFKHSEAELLVKQTFRGALNLFHQNSYDCKEWISKVASKGGTTEAAITHFNESGLHEIIVRGAKKALKRSEELGK